jgi:predicted ATPase
VRAIVTKCQGNPFFEVAYHSLLRRTRQQYHRQIAEMLVRQFADLVETQPEVLAQHYTEAGLHQPAVDYWHQAGQHTAGRSAYVEAVSHCTKGLEILQALPDTTEGACCELGMQLTLGSSLSQVGDYS